MCKIIQWLKLTKIVLKFVFVFEHCNFIDVHRCHDYLHKRIVFMCILYVIQINNDNSMQTRLKSNALFRICIREKNFDIKRVHTRVIVWRPPQTYVHVGKKGVVLKGDRGEGKRAKSFTFHWRYYIIRPFFNGEK